MQIKGKCIQVLPLETGASAKGEWKKRNFVIEYGEEYPKKACFQLFGNKVDMTPREGNNLTVHFSPESKEYNGKWYTQLNCWKLEGFTGNLQPQAPSMASKSGFDALPKTDVGGAADDLPF